MTATPHPNQDLEIEIFRAGDYGPRGTYSEEDIERIAYDYDPDTVHEAPVTVDHQQDGPALGWVKNLRHAGSVLFARIRILDPAFLEKLKAGAFKKRSVELYRATRATGRPYLRALTFLGAGTPVIKGLPDPTFCKTPDKSTWIDCALSEPRVEEEEAGGPSAQSVLEKIQSVVGTEGVLDLLIESTKEEIEALLEGPDLYFHQNVLVTLEHAAGGIRQFQHLLDQSR